MSKRWKIGLGLVALALMLAGLFLAVGRTWLAQRAFDSAIDANAGIDRSLALGDGLHVYVCGSGSPMPDADRTGPCLGVLAGRDAFVVDAGSGSIRKLQRMGFPMDRLQGVFLTHLHSDHIDGLGELLLQAWIAGGRNTPLPVHGPQGTGKVVAGLMQAYDIDKGYRIAHHGPAVARPDGFGGAAIESQIPNQPKATPVFQSGAIRISAFAVDHAPIAPAYGYRIDYKGRSVTISGDTVYSTNLVAAAKGTDVLFHEALNKPMIAALGAKLAQRGRKEQAQIMTDIQGYHASPEDAAKAAHRAGAKALVLYHLVPAPPVRLIEPLFLGKAPAYYQGELRLAHDGMLVSLPAGSTAIKFSDGW